MATFKWQEIARQQLDQLYQTDIYPLEIEDILVATLPESQRLGDKVDEQQRELMENIRTLLLTKSEDHTEEISLPENTDAITFERTSIVNNYRSSKMQFAAWINSQAPLSSKCKIAFLSTNTFVWDYIAEDFTSSDNHELYVTFKLKVSVHLGNKMCLVENWLRRQDIIHLCEVNEIFDMYLTNLNFDCIVSSHESEDLLENLIVQRKLQQKLNHSLNFFHSYGLIVEIAQLKWETKKTESKPESLTAKIEKNRKESPLDDTRYDRLQIGDIMHEKQFDRQVLLAKERSNKEDMISQITSTRRIKKNN